eukprot:3192607-Pleurochrysis_carterae.AAC.2
MQATSSSNGFPYCIGPSVVPAGPFAGQATHAGSRSHARTLRYSAAAPQRCEAECQHVPDSRCS